MTFRPNMTEEQIRAEDLHRGKRGAPIHPPSMSNPPFGGYQKGMDTPEAPPVEEEEEVDVDLEGGEDLDEEMEASLKGFPFGKKQAIAAEQSGIAEKASSQSALEAPGMHGAKEGRGMAKSKLDKFVVDMKENAERTKKALNSRSMHIPRPVGAYDPFGIQRSATTPVTRNHSALRGPEGVAPLIGDTFELLAEDEEVRTRSMPDAYKSCNVHGITYRANRSCHPCSIAKSAMCKCGGQMDKGSDGGFKCASCGK